MRFFAAAVEMVALWLAMLWRPGRVPIGKK